MRTAADRCGERRLRNLLWLAGIKGLRSPLRLVGVPVAVALSATLLFRGLSFWLPMLPGLVLSRRELGGKRGAGPRSSG